MSKSAQELEFVQAECARYASPNAVVTINTVKSFSLFFLPCVYFCLQMKNPEIVWFFTKGGVPPLPPIVRFGTFPVFLRDIFCQDLINFCLDICSE